MALYNKIDKKVLKERLANDDTPRTTISFYKYVFIEDPTSFRNRIYRDWEAIGVMGRIYVANEGINAQMSVPTANWNTFDSYVQNDPLLTGTPYKIAVEDDGKSFYKLVIKVKQKILADGLNDKTFKPWDTGNHLSAQEFNKAIDQGAIVIDMRNHYESEVGHFQNAVKPDCDAFRDEIAMVEEYLKGKEDEKVLLYCTGGIRCEKASAYFKHRGFSDVNQLHGGIISYAHQVEEQGLENKYIGKNFVFDERLGERISDDIIAKCHQCGTPCDTHTNCKNEDCHLLFIQCEECAKKHEGCCSQDCVDTIHMPIEEQRIKRKGKKKENAQNIFKKGRIEGKITIEKDQNSVLRAVKISEEDTALESKE